ncbi:MAG: NifU family protein [Pseudarcicella sp.]|jgi:Fe-S cluster biogenesis protein NfuA|nr:NifU family protein [Pseudarcicella sp.]MBP6410429.1 NifU family protein [Pseudarcicella sp.]
MLKPQIFIYTESTPNPNSMKFVLNFELAPEGLSFDYATESESTTEGKSSPLATELFAFDYVKRVFISSNFISVTKTETVAWEDVLFALKQHLKAFFEDQKEVFTKATIEKNEIKVEGGDSDTVIKIKAVLEQYVRPAVESDGGAINFHSFEDGVVKVLLQGSCSGCPSSTMTLKQGIENLLTRMVPEVKEVVAEGV